VKNITSFNTEAIVFVVEQDQVRRLLGMYLAAVGLNVRTYSTCDEFLARHDSSQTKYLVLDMYDPGIKGPIIYRQKFIEGDLSGENLGDFQGMPVKSWLSYELFLSTKRRSNAVILDSADGAFLNGRELEL
jgi:hypothetical protein